MRSCSAASLEIPYAHLLTGDAMSLQPLKNQIPGTELAWNLVLGIWFLGCLFFGFATGRAWAGYPRRPLPVMPLGTGKDLMVGETVIAIGNAYGYEHTVTVGVVSALKRDVVLNKEISYKGLIQTDASINPGNSGGPLLNINGEMVGVNVAIRPRPPGLSFAIPADNMTSAVPEIMSIRKRQNLWHGLVCAD